MESLPSPPAPLADHAIRLAEELDAAVFPVRVYPDPEHPGRTKKQPLVKNWQNGGAVSDPEAIAQLFERHSTATHAGIQTGRLLLVDLDGDQAQAWWREHIDILPPTRTQPTHREGGLHLFYRLPEGVELRNSAGEVAPGVDIRASGGFACDWSRDHPPAVEEVVEAPAGLIAYIRGSKQAQAAHERPDRESGAAIRAGRRNDYLSREAFRLRKQGSSVAQILAVLRTLNAVRCRPPVGDAELRGIAEGKRGIEAEPEPPDFSTIEAPSLADLLSLPTVPRTWFFESIIPAGAFLIVGRPKVGKSWLLLQLALAAAGGQSFLGYQNVDQADD